MDFPKEQQGPSQPSLHPRTDRHFSPPLRRQSACLFLSMSERSDSRMTPATPTAGSVTPLGFWLLLLCLGCYVGPALKSPLSAMRHFHGMHVPQCHMQLFLQETKMQPQNTADHVRPKPFRPFLLHSPLGAGIESRVRQ